MKLEDKVSMKLDVLHLTPSKTTSDHFHTSVFVQIKQMD